MHAQEIWTGDSISACALRTLLTPASWLYAAGWQTYLGIYALGIKRAQEPHTPVVCVGNLQVGGTGKTPVTLHLSDLLTELGRKVAISCSGYGSQASAGATVAPEGPLQASRWGDEAALIRWLRPALPLIVGRRRVLAAQLCRERFPDHVMLMDDGFQHLPLKKHVSIVLDPPQVNRRCLPAGPYREPRRNSKRADLVIPGDQFRIVETATGFVDAAGKPRALRGEVSLLCALGRPQGFLSAMEAGGLSLHSTLLLGDHDPLDSSDLLERFSSTLPIVVTGKDWVKLRERPDVEKYDVVVATHEVVIESQNEFRNWLQAKLNGIGNKEN